MGLRPRKKNPRPGKFEKKPPPLLFGGLKVTGRPPSRSEIFFFSIENLTAKGSFCLQNDALVAILIVEGREVVFRKA